MSRRFIGKMFSGSAGSRSSGRRRFNVDDSEDAQSSVHDTWQCRRDNRYKSTYLKGEMHDCFARAYDFISFGAPGEILDKELQGLKENSFSDRVIKDAVLLETPWYTTLMLAAIACQKVYDTLEKKWDSLGGANPHHYASSEKGGAVFL